jgi:hypothetical protein
MQTASIQPGAIEARTFPLGRKSPGFFLSLLWLGCTTWTACPEAPPVHYTELGIQLTSSPTASPNDSRILTWTFRAILPDDTSPSNTPIAAQAVVPDEATLTLNGQPLPFGPSYSYAWDTTALPDGTYTFEVQATWQDLSADQATPYVLDRAAASAVATFVPLGGPIATELVGEGELNDVAVAFEPSDAPLVAWTGAFVSGGDDAPGTTVRRWDGSAWQAIGSAGVGPAFSGETSQPSLVATPSGVVLLAWAPTTVEEWVGQSWIDDTVESAGRTLLNPSLTSLGETVLLGCDAQTPGGSTLALFLRDAGGWDEVGPPLADPTSGTPRVAIDGSGFLYAAYESPASGGIHVVRWDSSGWQALGEDVLLGAPKPSLAGLLINADGQPVLAGLDGDSQLELVHWTGTAWASLGSPRPIAPPQPPGALGVGPVPSPGRVGLRSGRRPRRHLRGRPALHAG